MMSRLGRRAVSSYDATFQPAGRRSATAPTSPFRLLPDLPMLPTMGSSVLLGNIGYVNDARCPSSAFIVVAGGRVAGAGAAA